MKNFHKIGISSEARRAYRRRKKNENANTPLRQCYNLKRKIAERRGQLAKRNHVRAEEPALNSILRMPILKCSSIRYQSFLMSLLLLMIQSRQCCKGQKRVRENKISFKTQRPLTRKRGVGSFSYFLEFRDSPYF